MTEAAAEVEAQPAVHDARPLPLEERVLEVMARHPEGIRLVDIGNDLGVDWRSLLGISRTIIYTTPKARDRTRQERRQKW